METAFDGASSSLRMGYKGLLHGAPDSLAARELRYLWDRSHHLCRNNAAAVTAKNRLTAHWIGTGIKVKWKDKKMQKAWDEFAKNPSIDGYGSLYNLQNLWAGAYFESGEVFTRMIFQKGTETIPLKLQVIEAEQLDPLYTQLNNTRYGITFNSLGKPLKYNFWNRHPQEMRNTEMLLRTAVDASDVLHIFSRERPGQWRGIPKLTPALLPIYEMDELTDATLVRQKVAQAVGWIIKKQSSGSLPLLGSLQDATSENTSDSEELGKKIQKILPGGVHYLEADEDFEFAAVDDIGANLMTLLQHQWRLIASCLDVTYEQLTGDLTGVNFSSIRAGLIEFRRRVALVQLLVFINLGMEPLLQRFKEYAALYISASAANSTYKYVFPKQEWVDPLKDAQADIAEIRAGLSTLQDKLAERGVEDIEEHLQQLAKEQGYEIVLDSNPKHNTMDKKQVAEGQDNTATTPAKKSKTQNEEQ